MKLNLIVMTFLAVGISLMSCGGGSSEKQPEKNIEQETVVQNAEPVAEEKKVEETVPTPSEEIKKEVEAVDQDVDNILKDL